MRRTARGVAIVLTLSGAAAVFASQIKSAQRGQTPSSPDVDITFRQQANLTPQEMLDQARKDMQTMQAGLKRVMQLQGLARKQNDIIKLNCVNDKLVQIRAAINIAESSQAELRDAISRGDEGGRGHAYTKLTVATQKVQVLVTEAENCVGSDLSFIGETRVETEVDPNIPDEDVTEPGLPYPTASRPPEASPFI